MQQITMDESPYITVNPAAEIAKVCPQTIRQLAIDGKIRGRKIGKQWLFNKYYLVEDINFLMSVKEENEWQKSTKDRGVPSTTYRTRMQTVSEYEKVLGLKKKS